MSRQLPVLADNLEALETCAYCPKLCRSACPVAEVDKSETLTPWGMMTTAWLAHRAELPPEVALHQSVWGCTGCYGCRPLCEHKNPVVETLFSARMDLSTEGGRPPIATHAIRRQAEVAAVQRARVEELAADPAAEAESSTALLVGCGYFQSQPVLAREVLQITANLLGPVRLIAECCGAALPMAGDRDGANAARARIDRMLVGVDKLIVYDPGCAMALERHAPVPLVRLVAEHLDRLHPIESATPYRYHDPCQLGRGLGEYDAPRMILRHLLGKKAAEFDRNREHAVCSGAGGLLPLTLPDISRQLATDRVAEHSVLGGGSVVTACAQGFKRFDGFCNVVDLMSLVAQGLR